MEFYLNEMGKCHRVDGPAFILYNQDGKKVQDEYWIYDKEYKDIFMWAIKATSIRDEG